jgi:hypothetical protein
LVLVLGAAGRSKQQSNEQGSREENCAHEGLSRI